MWGEMPSKFQSLPSWYYTPAYVMAFDMGTEKPSFTKFQTEISGEMDPVNRMLPPNKNDLVFLVVHTNLLVTGLS